MTSLCFLTISSDIKSSNALKFIVVMETSEYVSDNHLRKTPLGELFCFCFHKREAQINFP